MEDLQTEYDYSSDIEGIFSEPKSEKKTDKNLSQTSLLFASIKSDRPEDKGKAHGKSEEETGNRDVFERQLITWAAKLELESLTLKDILQGNLGHIFKQNYSFLQTISEDISQRMTRVESSVLGIEHQLGESENAQKELDMLNMKLAAMTEKIEQATEKERKNDKANAKGTKRQIEIEEKNLARFSIDEILKNKDIKEHLSLLKEIHERLESIDDTNKARATVPIQGSEEKNENESYNNLSECLLAKFEDATYKSIMPAIQEKVAKEIELTLGSLLNKVILNSVNKLTIDLNEKGSQNAVGDNSKSDGDHKFIKDSSSGVWIDSTERSLADEIKSVKSFLKLLLPRVVGLESRYKELAFHFNSLVDICGKSCSEYLTTQKKSDGDTENTNYGKSPSEYSSKRRKREAG